MNCKPCQYIINIPTYLNIIALLFQRNLNILSPCLGPEAHADGAPYEAGPVQRAVRDQREDRHHHAKCHGRGSPRPTAHEVAI